MAPAPSPSATPPGRSHDPPATPLLDIQRAQQHAAVELFRELSRKNPEVGLARQLQGFRRAFQQLGLVLPENVSALIVLDRQFTGEHC
jgi:hypothetical protein